MFIIRIVPSHLAANEYPAACVECVEGSSICICAEWRLHTDYREDFLLIGGGLAWGDTDFSLCNFEPTVPSDGP